MKKAVLAFAIALSLSACASTKAPPRNPDNACAIMSERRDYARAMSAVERRWGIPVHVQLATMHQESSFRGDAKPPRKKPFLFIIPRGRISSAYGYSQALDGTWAEYKAGPGRGIARRDNIHDAADFMGWYMADSSKRLGIARSDAYSQYLAYHEGKGGYARGSHRSKPWLLGVASKVEVRSQRYRAQLASCGRR
ncbi:hypothetical protein ACEUZ9_001118 [Paracoccus litorisediminis]|uniref:transglycosylase SLT domain-containing protein n=1 Tax=Paracoccus litorisediminis TaxID=2006130 RepID=UPI00372F0996